MIEQVSLSQLLEHWIESDYLLKAHFICAAVSPNHSFFEIYCSCNQSKSAAFRYGGEKRVAKVENSIVLICEGPHTVCKFHIAHPMFFQKLRGWIFDMHNRLGLACNEYLR